MCTYTVAIRERITVQRALVAKSTKRAVVHAAKTMMNEEDTNSDGYDSDSDPLSDLVGNMDTRPTDDPVSTVSRTAWLHLNVCAVFVFGVP